MSTVVMTTAAAAITLHVPPVTSVFMKRGSVTETLTVMTAATNRTVSETDPMPFYCVFLGDQNDLCPVVTSGHALVYRHLTLQVYV